MKYFLPLIAILLSANISAAECIQPPGTMWDAGTAGTCQYEDHCWTNSEGQVCQEASCTEAGDSICCVENNGVGIGCYEEIIVEFPVPTEPEPTWADQLRELLEKIGDFLIH